MRSYMHPNTATPPPTLSGRSWERYQAVVRGLPFPHFADAGDNLVEDLRLIAERIACEQIVAQLVNLGLDAQAVSRDRYTYHEAAVCILTDDEIVSFDSEAGARVAQRIQSGLPVSDALRRTVEQCERPVLSETALQEMEAASDAAVRRLG